MTLVSTDCLIYGDPHTRGAEQYYTVRGQVDLNVGQVAVHVAPHTPFVAPVPAKKPSAEDKSKQGKDASAAAEDEDGDDHEEENDDGDRASSVSHRSSVKLAKLLFDETEQGGEDWSCMFLLLGVEKAVKFETESSKAKQEWVTAIAEAIVEAKRCIKPQASSVGSRKKRASFWKFG